MRNRPVLLSLLAAAAGAVAGAAAMRWNASRDHLAEDLWGEAEAQGWAPPAPRIADEDGDAEPTPTELRRLAREKADAVAAARRQGDPEERGRTGSVGFDLGRLQANGQDLEPVVQYLTYIQSRRGDDSSLLFIRYDDIDAMAELDGEPSEELLERLDQLGVVVSAN